MSSFAWCPQILWRNVDDSEPFGSHSFVAEDELSGEVFICSADETREIADWSSGDTANCHRARNVKGVLVRMKLKGTSDIRISLPSSFQAQLIVKSVVMND